MKRIGIISDTHSHWDERYLKHFEQCDEIWHAGDICDMETIERLEQPFGTNDDGTEKRRIVRAVCGNCDGGELRRRFKETERWKCEGVEVLMKHIGGYPGRYDRSVIGQMYANPPKLFISGHSHILKVVRDPKRNMLVLNPGAAGIQGFHIVRTTLRFKIEDGNIHSMEVFELDRK